MAVVLSIVFLLFSMFNFHQIIVDAEHRSKIIETFWLFWTFLQIGFDNGILGPCLPDLQASVDATLEQMSYIFFVQGTGALLGIFLGFWPDRRLDRRLLIGVYVLCGSIVNIAIPLVPNYYYLLVLFLLQGMTKGLADFGAMSLCNVLWQKNKALPFQFIVVGAGISTFVSPFLAQPFISDNLTKSPAADSCPNKHTGEQNMTKMMLLSNSTELLSESYSNTSIKWPFLIVGSVTAPAAVAFIYFFFTKASCNEKESLNVEITVTAESPTNSRTSLLKDGEKGTHQSKTVMLFRTLIIFLNLPVFGLLLTFADLLTSIGMSSPLCMTPKEASYFNTVLWGASMIGRAGSAIILTCVPMFLQLTLCSVALVAMGTVLVVSPSGSQLALWFGTAGVGLFATPSMPGFIAWSGDYVTITPFFMNLSLCAAGVGEMFIPFVGGQLMAAFSSWAMMLFALMIMITMLILFILSYYVGRRINQ